MEVEPPFTSFPGSTWERGEFLVPRLNLGTRNMEVLPPFTSLNRGTRKEKRNSLDGNGALRDRIS
ncbi:hypothetical protein ACE1CI_24810 [Aerosakkonemataceae cyanobacterium BLCC-F50]|uniref:Uncharacterized protein n=1 Tax=Floridaenema flaviceps BLCC-F50 TaxID=3153642 RepID=A0ABV4XWV4_9CYAN